MNDHDLGRLLVAERLSPVGYETAIEIRRRLTVGAMSPGLVAALLDGEDSSWRSLQIDVVDALSVSQPRMAAAVVAAWCQRHPDAAAARVEQDERGAYYNKQFAARASFRDFRGEWCVCASKKVAKRSALWSSIRAYLTATNGADVAPWPPPKYRSAVGGAALSKDAERSQNGRR